MDRRRVAAVFAAVKQVRSGRFGQVESGGTKEVLSHARHVLPAPASCASTSLLAQTQFRHFPLRFSILSSA